jgi:hypothetical protein
MPGVTAVIIGHDNQELCLTRLERDLLPALRVLREAGWTTDLVVVDNSAYPLIKLRATVMTLGLPWGYEWNNGDNPQYGPALNRACKIARHPYLLYMCTNHGVSYDPTWGLDLLAPLVDNPTAAMSGSYWHSGKPEQLGFPGDLPEHHIQGGVFAARRDVVLQHPWPEDEHRHYGSDLVMSWQLLVAGYRIVDVPTVKSVWRGETGEGTWKFVHEGGVDAEPGRAGEEARD